VQVRRTAGSSDKTNGITAMFALALRYKYIISFILSGRVKKCTRTLKKH